MHLFSKHVLYDRLEVVTWALVLFLSLVFLATTESKEKRKADKRGVLINVGNDGKAGGGSSVGNDAFGGNGDKAPYVGGRNADHLGQGFSNGVGQTANGASLFQILRAARPVPVAVSSHVPVAVPQPYPVTVPKLYPVAVPHPVTVSVPRPYPVSVPRPVPVPVPHPVPVPVPQPVGVPVPKPYPVPVPHPVPVPSTFLAGTSAGGIPFGGLEGGFFGLGRGAASYGGGVFLAPAESHGFTTGYGYGWPPSDLSYGHQIPLRLPAFEPSNSDDGISGNTPGAAYNGQGQHQPASTDAVVAGSPSHSFSYVQNDKGVPPSPPAVVPTPSRSEVPALPGDGYHHGTGYKV
ncbi:skin secretory protein xP2-like [Cryptotermes secundus]|uniref:skin secretory protein xP2-like n=1 Tax=Cryptotermes secundus TaxID=105785 RepID=UPI000CD7AB2C|nr:skin secretory protein xP2-like [Cryptotermes secundus]